MSRGLGAFAKGLAEGYVTGAKIKSQREKDEREQEMFGLQKQKTELELDAARREEAFKRDMEETQKQISAKLRGSVTGEVEDEMTGQSMGQMTYAQGQAPNAGLRFRSGTAVEQKPIDMVDATNMLADETLRVALKHGKMTVEQGQQAMDLKKRMKDEGIDEAVKTWLTTGDKVKAAEVFNKKGDFKFDPNTMDIQTVKDPNGLMPDNVVVTKAGEDGTPQIVFDYQQLARAGMSREAYSKALVEADKLKFTEKSDLMQLGMKLDSDERLASNKIAADLAKTANSVQQENIRALMSARNANITAALRNPQSAFQQQFTMAVEDEITAGAIALVMQGKDPGTAQAQARSEVYRRRNIDARSFEAQLQSPQ